MAVVHICEQPMKRYADAAEMCTTCCVGFEFREVFDDDDDDDDNVAAATLSCKQVALESIANNACDAHSFPCSTWNFQDENREL